MIAATSDTDVNIRVYEDAERRAMLVNVVDVPPLCNFILPAIFRSGPLAIAISTAGASPRWPSACASQIAEEYGEPYARLAELLNEVRGWAKGTLPTYQDRKEFFETIVNGEPDPVELLRQGDEQAVRDLIAAAQAQHGPHSRPELSHRRLRGARPDGGRRRQARDRPPRGGRGQGAHGARDGRAPSRPATRRRATWSAPRASPGSRPPSAPPS